MRKTTTRTRARSLMSVTGAWHWYGRGRHGCSAAVLACVTACDGRAQPRRDICLYFVDSQQRAWAILLTIHHRPSPYGSTIRKLTPCHQHHGIDWFLVTSNKSNFALPSGIPSNCRASAKMSCACLKIFHLSGYQYLIRSSYPFRYSPKTNNEASTFFAAEKLLTIKGSTSFLLRSCSPNLADHMPCRRFRALKEGLFTVS